MSPICNKDPPGYSCGENPPTVNSPEAELWLDLMSSMLNFAMTSTSLMKSIQSRKMEKSKGETDCTEKMLKHIANIFPVKEIESSNYTLQSFPMKEDTCQKETCNIGFKSEKPKGNICRVCSKSRKRKQEDDCRKETCTVLYKSQEPKGELCQECSKKICSPKRSEPPPIKKKQPCKTCGKVDIDLSASKDTLLSANLIPPKLERGDCQCQPEKAQKQEEPKESVGCQCEIPEKLQEPLCSCPPDGPPAEYCDAATSSCICPEDGPPAEYCDAAESPCTCPQEGPPAEYCDAAAAPCTCPEQGPPAEHCDAVNFPCPFPEEEPAVENCDSAVQPCLCPKVEPPPQFYDAAIPGTSIERIKTPPICECPEKTESVHICDSQILCECNEKNIPEDDFDLCTCPGGDAPPEGLIPLTTCVASKGAPLQGDDESICTCPSLLVDAKANDISTELEAEISVASCECQTVSSENLLAKELHLANLTYQLRQTDKSLKELKKEMDRIANLVSGKRKCSFADAAALYDEIMKPRTSFMGVNGMPRNYRSSRKRHQGHF